MSRKIGSRKVKSKTEDNAFVNQFEKNHPLWYERDWEKPPTTSNPKILAIYQSMFAERIPFPDSFLIEIKLPKGVKGSNPYAYTCAEEIKESIFKAFNSLKYLREDAFLLREAFENYILQAYALYLQADTDDLNFISVRKVVEEELFLSSSLEEEILCEDEEDKPVKTKKTSVKKPAANKKCKIKK